MDHRLGVTDGAAFQRRPLALQHPQLVGVAGDERWLTRKLLLRNRPEISAEEGRGGVKTLMKRQREQSISMHIFLVLVLLR